MYWLAYPEVQSACSQRASGSGSQSSHLSLLCHLSHLSAMLDSDSLGVCPRAGGAGLTAMAGDVSKTDDFGPCHPCACFSIQAVCLSRHPGVLASPGHFFLSPQWHPDQLLMPTSHLTRRIPGKSYMCLFRWITGRCLLSLGKSRCGDAHCQSGPWKAEAGAQSCPA